MKSLLLIFGFLCAWLPGLSAAETPTQATTQAPVQTVASVDLKRYLGTWHEIARFPNRFQTQCAANVQATYALNKEGAVGVLNRCQKDDSSWVVAQGVGKVVDPVSNAKLKVLFAPKWLAWVPWVWGDYWIIGLSPDYRWALVGTPARDYLWILARQTTLPKETLEQIKTIAVRQNFAVADLVMTPQKP